MAKIKKFRKYPLRNLNINIKWIIDSSLHGCVDGEGNDWTICISLSNDGNIIRDTIAHELAHIHAYVYYRKEKGENIFYSHGKLHRDLEAYYEERWYEEIEDLFEDLQIAEVDIHRCDEHALKDIVEKYANYHRMTAVFA